MLADLEEYPQKPLPPACQVRQTRLGIQGMGRTVRLFYVQHGGAGRPGSPNSGAGPHLDYLGDNRFGKKIHSALFQTVEYIFLSGISSNEDHWNGGGFQCGL